MNIQNLPRFVSHGATWDHAQMVDDFSAILPHRVSEVAQPVLPLLVFDDWPVPRLQDA